MCSSDEVKLIKRTPCSRILSEKLIGPQLDNKLHTFMKVEGSLPYSHKPTSGPDPQPAEFSPPTHTLISLRSTLVFIYAYISQVVTYIHVS
jgi:hypothetical protein